MISECVIDFVKKYKKYIIIICIVFIIILLWKLSKQENIEKIDNVDNADNVDNVDNTKKDSDLSLGGFLLSSCLFIICGFVLPCLILYYITKKSAKAALKSTPCVTMSPHMPMLP